MPPLIDLSGSINTTSIGKTNFWDSMFKLFGVSQPPDVGILGYKMPSDSFGPQAHGLRSRLQMVQRHRHPLDQHR